MNSQSNAVKNFGKIGRLIEQIDKTVNVLEEESIDLCRRGFCGKINIEKILCSLLLDSFEVKDKNTYPFYSQKYGTYIKKGCICDGRCEDVIDTCVKDPALHCGGHHITIFSDNNSLKINDSDIVLDFTYKQLLLEKPKNTYTTEEKELISSLPNYLLLNINDYKNYSKVPRWKTLVSRPCFVISQIACNVSYRRISGGYKRTKKRKQYKKNTKKRRNH